MPECQPFERAALQVGSSAREQAALRQQPLAKHRRRSISFQRDKWSLIWSNPGRDRDHAGPAKSRRLTGMSCRFEIEPYTPKEIRPWLTFIPAVELLAGEIPAAKFALQDAAPRHSVLPATAKETAVYKAGHPMTSLHAWTDFFASNPWRCHHGQQSPICWAPTSGWRLRNPLK